MLPRAMRYVCGRDWVPLSIELQKHFPLLETNRDYEIVLRFVVAIADLIDR